jgi:hypothetical protein
MKIYYYILIPLTLFLLSFGCEGKEESAEDIPEEQIVGEWGWIESVYYHTISGKPYILNPDTVGYTLRYVYSIDGTYKVFRNNKLKSSGNYWFEIQDFSDEEEQDIRLINQQDDYTKSIKFQLKGDSLILDQTKEDNAKRIFIRLK